MCHAKYWHLEEELLQRRLLLLRLVRRPVLPEKERMLLLRHIDGRSALRPVTRKGIRGSVPRKRVVPVRGEVEPAEQSG
jgi:hypothetical protein